MFIKNICRLLVVLLAIILLQSCHVRKNVYAASKQATDRILFIPVASAGVFTDLATKIYAADSLRDQTPVEMKNMKLKFYNSKDTLQFSFDNVKFHFTGKKLFYDGFVFPQWDISKLSDTMRFYVSFSYTTPLRPSARPFQTAYFVDRGKISPATGP